MVVAVKSPVPSCAGSIIEKPLSSLHRLPNHDSSSAALLAVELKHQLTGSGSMLEVHAQADIKTNGRRARALSVPTGPANNKARSLGINDIFTPGELEAILAEVGSRQSLKKLESVSRCV